METRSMITNDVMPVIFDQQVLRDHNGPASSSLSIEEADEAARCSNILDDLTRFEVASSLDEILSSEDVVLNTLEEGKSIGAKRKFASEKKVMDVGVKQDMDTGVQSKQQIRTPSAELHNQNERIRRQKQKEKIKTLQELIPNCNKRDRSSTLDDAIKYIKSLQHKVQHQMMPMGEGYSTFHSPMMMMQQKRQQEMQMSSTSYPTFMQACPPRGCNTGGTEYEIGTGIPGVFAPFNSPSNPYFLSSSGTSRLPLESPSNIVSSCMEWTPFKYATSLGPESITLQGPTSEQSVTWRESTARVLPSKVVQSHQIKEVIMDCGSSISVSNEWSRSSTARKPEEEEHGFQINEFKFEKDLSES